MLPSWSNVPDESGAARRAIGLPQFEAMRGIGSLEEKLRSHACEMAWARTRPAGMDILDASGTGLASIGAPQLGAVGWLRRDEVQVRTNGDEAFHLRVGGAAIQVDHASSAFRRAVTRP